MVTAMRKHFHDPEEEHGFGKVLKEMVDEGKMEFVKIMPFMRGNPDQPAELYRVVESSVVIYKRID